MLHLVLLPALCFHPFPTLVKLVNSYSDFKAQFVLPWFLTFTYGTSGSTLLPYGTSYSPMDFPELGIPPFTRTLIFMLLYFDD